MARVGFEHKVILASGLRVPGDPVVHNIMMRDAEPAGAVGAERTAVNEDRRLSAGFQIQRDALSLRGFRNRHRAAKPEVFIAFAPFRPRGHGREGVGGSIPEGQLLLCQKTLDRNLALGKIEILLQGIQPVCQPVPPFGTHVLHGLSSFLFALILRILQSSAVPETCIPCSLPRNRRPILLRV